MVRIVRAADGKVSIDPTGKLNGRGTYLCHEAQCWDRAMRSGSLARALKTTLSPDDRALLDEVHQVFTATSPREGEAASVSSAGGHGSEQ
jgi:predicted RNA-binding protein YlxR (DUF448 family)